MIDGKQTGADDRYFDCLLEELLCVLLAFRIQIGFRTSSQGHEIELLKHKIADLLDENPWLQVRLMHRFSKIYYYARKRAMIHTGFKPSAFPEVCPWQVSDIINVSIFQI